MKKDSKTDKPEKKTKRTPRKLSTKVGVARVHGIPVIRLHQPCDGLFSPHS